MNITKRVRVATVPGITWAVPDLRRWAFRALIFSFCLASALLLTALRLEITRLHYGLSDLHGQRQLLSAEVARLEVEAAALTAPRVIEEQARKLGMVYPDRTSIVVLDE